MIRSYYKLSKATYCRLKKSDESFHQGNPSNESNLNSRHLSEEAKHLLLELVDPPKPPTMIKNLQLKLFEVLQEYYHDIVIRKYLRNVLKYSFK